MADNKAGKNGHSDVAAEPAAQPAQVQVLGQYIKDLSFENPNVNRLMESPGEAPSLKLEVNVAARQTGPEMYESAIDFKAHATNKIGTIYDLELVYAGLFKIRNIPEQALEPFLLINCPSLIFPFLRRLVADISREGGFPPLFLDPIDFAGLYVRRQKELQGAATEPRKS